MLIVEVKKNDDNSLFKVLFKFSTKLNNWDFRYWYIENYIKKKTVIFTHGTKLYATPLLDFVEVCHIFLRLFYICIVFCFFFSLECLSLYHTFHCGASHYYEFEQYRNSAEKFLVRMLIYCPKSTHGNLERKYFLRTSLFIGVIGHSSK